MDQTTTVKDVSWFKSHDQGTWVYQLLIRMRKRINIIVTSIPKLMDLYQHITPQYAADWKVIGTLLGLPSGELKAIEAGYPTNVKWCCNQMLEKWLEMDPAASWGKIFTAIESPAVSCCTGEIEAVDKGN